MKRMLVLPLILGPALAAAQEQPAAEIDYGYFEISYFDVSADVDVGGQIVESDGDGFWLDGSIELRDHIHAFVTYRNAKYDDAPEDNIGTRWGGLGTHWQVGSRLSVFGRLGFVNGEGDDGYYASAGVRYVPADGWEIRGGVRQFGWDDTEDATGGFIAGDLWLTDVAALTFNFESVEDSDLIAVGMRFYFGN